MRGHDICLNAMSAELFEATGETLDVRYLDVKVHPILARLLFGNLLKQQLRAGLAVGYEEDVVPDAAERHIAERRRPEQGKCLRVATIEHKTEARFTRHPVLSHGTARAATHVNGCGAPLGVECSSLRVSTTTKLSPRMEARSTAE